MMEIIHSLPVDEDPGKPPLSLTATLTDDGRWAVDLQGNGIPTHMAVVILLQMAAHQLDGCCPRVTANGAGPVVLRMTAEEIQRHYEQEHPDV